MLMTFSIMAMAKSIPNMTTSMASSHQWTTSLKSTEVEEASYLCKHLVTLRARESNMYQSLRSVNQEMKLACNRYHLELTQNQLVKSSRWRRSTSTRRNLILKRSNNPFLTIFIQIKLSTLWTTTPKTSNLMVITATLQTSMPQIEVLKESNPSLVNTRKTVYLTNKPSRLNFTKEGSLTTETVDKTQSKKGWKARRSLRSLQPVALTPTISSVIIGWSLKIDAPDSRSSLSKNNLMTSTTWITVWLNRISTNNRLINK